MLRPCIKRNRNHIQTGLESVRRSLGRVGHRNPIPAELAKAGKRWFFYCIRNFGGRTDKHCKDVVESWSNGLKHLHAEAHSHTPGHGCDAVFGGMRVSGNAYNALLAFWTKWAETIKFQRLYYGWNCTGLDGFHRELLMYRDKIHPWKKFMAIRHKLAVLRHNMGLQPFLEWLCK
jgi:hypothetical protein